MGVSYLSLLKLFRSNMQLAVLLHLFIYESTLADLIYVLKDGVIVGILYLLN